jgi:hypothetical protein
MAGEVRQDIFLATALILLTAVPTEGWHTYDVKMTYRCVALTNVTEGLTCSEWQQEGFVQQPSCFPGEATVMTKNGPKTMAKLEIGDEILGFDHTKGYAVFSPVRAWLHREPTGEVNMVAVKSSTGTLITSNRHSLAVQDGHAYKFAGDLEAGKDALLTSNGTGALVEKVYDVHATGLFAPLTATSNYFVGGPGETPAVLAHSFAQLQDPRRFEVAFHGSLSAAEFFWPSINEVDHTNNAPYVHPVARLWMRLAGIQMIQAFTYLNTKRTIQQDADLGFLDTDTRTVDEALARRRLGERRLNNNGGNNENNEEQMLIIIYSVIQVLPPFLRHGIIHHGTPGFVEGMVNPPPSDIEGWVHDRLEDNEIYSIVTGVSFGALFCCSICVQVLAGSGEGSKSTGGARDHAISRTSSEDSEAFFANDE